MGRFTAVRTLLANPAGLTSALIFATLSIVGANWISRIPEIKARLQLTESDLGLGLLGMPIGLVAITLVLGRLVRRYGAGRVTLWSTFASCVVMIGPALATSLPTFFLAMILIGIANGAMDVAMNDVAARVEVHIARPVLSACHGFYSVGGMIGAGTGALMAALGVPLLPHLIAVGLIMIVLVALRRTFLLAPMERSSVPHAERVAGQPDPVVEAHRTRLGNVALAGLIATSFVVFMGEGAVADWSAVYLTGTLGATAGFAALGYGVFSLMMALGRIFGDEAVMRWGSPAVLRMGAWLAAAGMAVALLLAHPVVALTGFGCVGLGYAVIVPILFRTAAASVTRTGSASLPVVAGSGYAGLLVGPPLVGFTAAAVSLTGALAIIVALTVLVAFFAPAALRSYTRGSSWEMRPAA